MLGEFSINLLQYKRLQLRSNQQGAALRRQEQQINRLKERLSVRPRDKGPCETNILKVTFFFFLISHFLKPFSSLYFPL